jgi:hypothetical protein
MFLLSLNMNKVKQTAVEWLLNELDYETICKFDKQLVQAKEMEKEQIIDAFYSGYEDRDLFKHSDDYYDKMYGK